MIFTYSLIRATHLSLPIRSLFKTKSYCLYKSYHQAKSILKLHREGHLQESLIFYSDMGIYKLLMAIEDSEIKQEYYEKTVASITEYDRMHDTDLVPVLRSYLKHDGSITV